MKTDREILEKLFPPSNKCRWCDAEPAGETGYCSDSCKGAAEHCGESERERGLKGMRGKQMEKSCETCVHHWPCSIRQDLCALAYKMERHNFIEGSVEDFITKIVASVAGLCHFYTVIEGEDGYCSDKKHQREGL